MLYVVDRNVTRTRGHSLRGSFSNSAELMLG